jgi:peroxiredoxin Q/BCP
MRLWIIVGLVALVVAGVAWRFTSTGSAPQIGTTAPKFTLPSQDGVPVSLRDYRGKWVVLYFYPKDFTSGCRIEAHNFQRDQEQYSKRNAIVLGVSVDSADSHKRFCAKEGLNFKLLADTRHQVSKMYGSLMNFGVAQMAARHTFIISPGGRIERTYLNVSPSGHSSEVLAALDDLQRRALTERQD